MHRTRLHLRGLSQAFVIAAIALVWSAAAVVLVSQIASGANLVLLLSGGAAAAAVGVGLARREVARLGRVDQGRPTAEPMWIAIGAAVVLTPFLKDNAPLLVLAEGFGIAAFCAYAPSRLR